jgi:hypothetical protein
MKVQLCWNTSHRHILHSRNSYSYVLLIKQLACTSTEMIGSDFDFRQGILQPNQWVRRLKRPGREADHSHQSTADRNKWMFIRTPPCALMAWGGGGSAGERHKGTVCRPSALADTWRPVHGAHHSVLRHSRYFSLLLKSV